MLQNIDGMQYDYLPHQEQYDARLSRLRPGLAEETIELIDEFCRLNREVTASRLFAVNGFSERYQETVAALGLEEEGSQLIGQMLWEVLRRRSEAWCFYRPESEGDVVPPGMRYWRNDDASTRS